MSEPASARRIDPETSPSDRLAEAVHPPLSPEPVRPAVETAPPIDAVPSPSMTAPTDLDVAGGAPGGFDQLSRIEDKTARIEEKYARSEARMQRVVDKVDAAMDRMSNVALQGDLAAVRGEIGIVSRRMRALPGFGAMMVTSAVTAILTVAILIALLRYHPALLAR